jgi:L-threonylcarbamoyladenylate synthase
MTADRIPLSGLLDGSADSEIKLEHIARHIDEGAIFVYPTETIYGIGGRGDSQAVRDRILAAKRRPPESPMILAAASRSAFAALDISFPRAAEILAQRFWPGPLTLVLPAANDPQGIGVRVSPHPFVRLLSTLIEVPVFSTSANISNQPYNGDPESLYHLFRDHVDFMIDAGPLPPSPPSSVVRIGADNSVSMLREGALSRREIEDALAGEG